MIWYETTINNKGYRHFNDSIKKKIIIIITTKQNNVYTESVYLTVEEKIITILFKNIGKYLCDIILF